jgi:hypothetical protein
MGVTLVSPRGSSGILAVAGSLRASAGTKQIIVVLKWGANPGNVAARHGMVPDHVYEHAWMVLQPLCRLAFCKLQDDRSGLDRAGSSILRRANQGTAADRTRSDCPVWHYSHRCRWNLKFKSSPVNADVAIIDTGIDLTHPDLNVVQNVSFVRRQKW